MEYLYLSLAVLLGLLLFAMQIRKLRRANIKKDSTAPKLNITINASNVYLDNEGIPKIDSESNTGAVIKTEPAVQDSSERRYYPRKATALLVDFVDQGRLFKEMSKNLSESGIFLRTRVPQNYNVGDFLTLAFQTLKGHPQKHDGKIVRKTHEGIGVQFIQA